MTIKVFLNARKIYTEPLVVFWPCQQLQNMANQDPTGSETWPIE